MALFDRFLDSIPLPQLMRVEQRFERPLIRDIPGDFLARLSQSGLLERIKGGQRVAIAVGSRGIANQPLILKLLVAEIKRRGGQPFIVPAMGSHGGANPEGQKRLLEEMGIREKDLGAPIHASMEVVELGSTEKGLPVYLDRYAHRADAVVIVNRIKPHVSFRGAYESGLLKMIAIGLGKQKGAESCHSLGFGQMEENIVQMARISLKQNKIAFAVALLENAYHQTCRIEFLGSEQIESREPSLLEEAKQLAPRLFFPALDVLVIDEMGKDISGTGFDTNVVGRFHNPHAYAPHSPRITRLVVLDLTAASRGNANGLGLADFTTRRVLEKIRYDQTYPNALTTTAPLSVKIPMVLDNDRQAIQAAVKTCHLLHKEEVRLVRIKNTLSLEEIEVSANLSDQVRGCPQQRLLSDPHPLCFDAQGNLS